MGNKNLGSVTDDPSCLCESAKGSLNNTIEEPLWVPLKKKTFRSAKNVFEILGSFMFYTNLKVPPRNVTLHGDSVKNSSTVTFHV